MRLVILAIVLASASDASYASDGDWVLLEDSGTLQYYMQNVEVGVDIDNGMVEAWSKTTYRSNGHTIEKNRYSCSKDEYLKLESHDYGADGHYQSGGRLQPVWASVIPESIGVLLIETACYAGAKQEIDKIQLADGGYTSNTTFELILSSFGRHAEAAIMDNIQDSVDNIEW